MREGRRVIAIEVKSAAAGRLKSGAAEFATAVGGLGTHSSTGLTTCTRPTFSVIIPPHPMVGWMTICSIDAVHCGTDRLERRAEATDSEVGY